MIRTVRELNNALANVDSPVYAKLDGDRLKCYDTGDIGDERDELVAEFVVTDGLASTLFAAWAAYGNDSSLLSIVLQDCADRGDGGKVLLGLTNIRQWYDDEHACRVFGLERSADGTWRFVGKAGRLPGVTE